MRMIVRKLTRVKFQLFTDGVLFFFNATSVQKCFLAVRQLLNFMPTSREKRTKKLHHRGNSHP